MGDHMLQGANLVQCTLPGYPPDRRRSRAPASECAPRQQPAFDVLGHALTDMVIEGGLVVRHSVDPFLPVAVVCIVSLVTY